MPRNPPALPKNFASASAVRKVTPLSIIDDDKLVRDTTKIMLRAKGYDVTTADGGRSGIAAITERKFDLAIVDLFMPDMDGLKVVEAIRRIDPGIPIIVASGFMFDGQCPQMPGFDVMAAEAAQCRRFTNRCVPMRCCKRSARRWPDRGSESLACNCPACCGGLVRPPLARDRR